MEPKTQPKNDRPQGSDDTLTPRTTEFAPPSQKPEVDLSPYGQDSAEAPDEKDTSSNVNLGQRPVKPIVPDANINQGAQP